MSETTRSEAASVYSATQPKNYHSSFWHKCQPSNRKRPGVKSPETMQAAGLGNDTSDLGMIEHFDLPKKTHASNTLTALHSEVYAKATGTAPQPCIAAFKTIGTLAPALGGIKIQEPKEAQADRNDLSAYMSFSKRGKRELEMFDRAEKKASKAIEAMNSFMDDLLQKMKTKDADPKWLNEQFLVARKEMRTWGMKTKIYRSANVSARKTQESLAAAFADLPKPCTTRMMEEMSACKQIGDRLEGMGTKVMDRFRIFIKIYDLHSKTLDKMEASLGAQTHVAEAL
ncbi:MAG: hypothetical protein AAF557_09495 [Pseudomonadota bacterium]